MAVVDPQVVSRYMSKIVTVPGESCRFWSGALSGRGHGRFWFGSGRVIIAHRFGFALAHGVDALEQARVLGHRCDNPICQRVDDDHVRVSSAVENRREWLSRRRELGPLADPRGPAARARMLRDTARVDPSLAAADLAGLRGRLGEHSCCHWARTGHTSRPRFDVQGADGGQRRRRSMSHVAGAVVKGMG